MVLFNLDKWEIWRLKRRYQKLQQEFTDVLHSDSCIQVIGENVIEAISAKQKVPREIKQGILATVGFIIYQEGICDLCEIDFKKLYSYDDVCNVRAYLEQKETFLHNYQGKLSRMIKAFDDIFNFILSNIPPLESNDSNDDDFTVSLYDLLPSVPQTLTYFIHYFHKQHINALFPYTQMVLDQNLEKAGCTPQDNHKMGYQELISVYLDQTGMDFFYKNDYLILLIGTSGLNTLFYWEKRVLVRLNF